jgi:glycosyltransferase involved in cell wall biosynthesis
MMSTLSNLIPARVTATDAPRRLRVLVSAFATAAQGGSEVAIGWNLCKELAAHHDVTVLCAPCVGSEDFRSRNDAYFAKHGAVDGLTMHYVQPPALSRWLQRGHMSFLKPLYYAGYAAWQRAALREARELHRAKPFDLAHHLNMTGFREPGYLWKLGIPFAWGPIGGAGNFPWAYASLLSPRERLFYGLRNASNELQKRTRRRPRQAAKSASILWAIGDDNREMIARHWQRDAELSLETGTDLGEANDRRDPYDGQRPLRIVWSGLHIGRKALPILLHALSRLPAGLRWEASILGDGRERQRWEALAATLRIDTKVTWKGSLLHADAKREMSRGDVLAFTSLQEGTPVTVLEALGMGLPVICHNACGMGLAVDDTCGFRVAPTGIQASVDGFADAIARLARDPQLLQDLSEGAILRARELSWQRLAAKLAADYELALANRRGS